MDLPPSVWLCQPALASGSVREHISTAVSKVEAKDADTAVITLKTPNSNLLWTLTGRA